MTHSIFGWSYPPGCSGPPDYDDTPCELCGQWPDDCICPECDICGEYGDPNCHKPLDKGGHGLIKTFKQNQSLARKELEWAEEARREDEYWSKRERELDHEEPEDPYIDPTWEIKTTNES